MKNPRVYHIIADAASDMLAQLQDENIWCEEECGICEADFREHVEGVIADTLLMYGGLDGESANYLEDRKAVKK